jgi:hypothetical protein
MGWLQRLRRPRFFFVFGLFFVLFLSGLAFFLRPPVLIVGDLPFISLYGTSRVRQRQVAASLALFRRVKPVIIAENAGPDIAVFAVEEADARPHAVIFPYRYAEGGRRYAGQFPRTRVIILDGPAGEGGSGGAGAPVNISVRRQDDFYRAGLMAGLIAQSQPEPSPEHARAGGEILVFQENALSPADKDALSAGLRAQGIEKPARFLNTPSEYAGLQAASCAVLAGGAADFFTQNPKIPVILFSWLDPALTSREVLLIFDDSPWALAAAALGAAKAGAGDIPSDIVFPRRRIAGRGLLRSLKRAARASFQ